MRFRRRRLLAFLLLLGAYPGLSYANDTVTVAVASNFATTATAIAAAFTEASDITVRLSPGSTGKLYAQILNGAPYDVFLAADVERPRLLEQQGQIIRGSRKTYATGSLVLWSRDERLRGRNCHDALIQGDYRRLALANPTTSPYGAAAREFLVAEKLWETVSPRAVYGENIAHSMQFVATGNAGMGFIAKAQTKLARLPAATCSWPVPETLHSPLRQQAVILKRAEGNRGAQAFLEFLASEAARRLIRDDGYRVSD